MSWVEFKNYLSQVTDLDQDALHIYAALLIMLAAAAGLRRPMASVVPWLCVLVVEIVNEAVDLAEPGRAIEQWQVLGGIQDMWNTMVLPTALFLLARFAPTLIVRRARTPLPEDSSVTV